jgi:hypothetical protein
MTYLAALGFAPLLLLSDLPALPMTLRRKSYRGVDQPVGRLQARLGDLFRHLGRALDLLWQRLLDGDQNPPRRLDRRPLTRLERGEHLVGQLRGPLNNGPLNNGPLNSDHLTRR